MNEYRGGESPTLELDDGLTAIAQQNAQAMADASDHLPFYDFVTALDRHWDVWSIGVPTSTAHPLGAEGLGEAFAEALLGDDGMNLAPCPRCTHLATGVAKSHGDAYAIVLMAGKIPGERLSEQQMATAEAHMAELVNTHRQAHGLAPLAHDPTVAAAARRWSTIMGAGHDFRHNPHAGSDYPPGMSFAGENIAAARLWGSLTLADIIETSFGDFVNSPWHNAAMLNADTTHIGVGVVLKAEWVWITQNFGQR